MNRIKVILFSLFLFFLFVPQNTHALSLAPSNYPFTGQNQFYSVFFRGNGEAVVTAKIIFTNTQDEDLTELKLRLPQVQPTDYLAFQVTKEPVCIRYDYPSDRNYLDKNTTYPCLEYQETNIDSFTYDLNNKYEKAEVSFQGDTFSVKLPQALETNAIGAVILNYRATGYAKKDVFGSYNFSFESLKTEEKIQSLTVGINTESDYHLRGTKGKTNYRFEESIAQLNKATIDSVAIRSPNYDFYGQIGQGELQKKTANLQPLESYTVKGSFADSFIKLYAKAIITLVIFALVVIGIIFLVMRTILHRSKLPEIDKAQEAVPASKNLVKSVLLALASSTVIVVYTMLLFFINSFVGSSVYYNFGIFVILFVGLFSLLVYSVFLLGPAIYTTVKKGFWWGFLTLGLTIVFIFIDFILLTLILFAFRTNYQQPIEYLSTSVKEITP